jgi:hypothetical protein
VANENLSAAKKAKNDEFYTQFQDIEKEMNAYLEYDPDVFKGKTVLLPCDDPEWSNFTKYFAQKFEDLGLKKLISTSYAPNSKPSGIPYQPTLFELDSPIFDPQKTKANGKIFTLTEDVTKNGVVNVDDLEWSYLSGDGDFRSEEITRLRDEADIIITNPPFSLFREFFSWLVESDKDFVIIGTMNAITYKEVFPSIMANKLWLGATGNGSDMVFRVPEGFEVSEKDKEKAEKLGYVGDYTRLGNSCWFSTLDHGRRHEPLRLMTQSDNLKFNKALHDGGYTEYENYKAIEVPRVEFIPSDYEGVMGVPISFLAKYNPEQFEIVGNGQTMANELGIKAVGQKFVDDYYSQGNKGQINAKWNNLVYRLGEKVVVPYQRILIKHKKATK